MKKPAKDKKMIIIEKCQWCGTLFIKESNAQKYCSTHCKKEAKKEKDRDYVNKHNLRKQYNTRIKNLVTLGSLGTSATSHMKKNFEEEYKSIQSELRMLHL